MKSTSSSIKGLNLPCCLYCDELIINSKKKSNSIHDIHDILSNCYYSEVINSLLNAFRLKKLFMKLAKTKKWTHSHSIVWQIVIIFPIKSDDSITIEFDNPSSMSQFISLENKFWWNEGKVILNSRLSENGAY